MKSSGHKTPQSKRRPKRKPSRHQSPVGAHGIEHVVLIIKENHGFDNYFGTLAGANGASYPRSPNPPPHDPDHSHAAWLTRKQTAVAAQFVAADIPGYFALARQFTLCDNYFTDVAGPSTPNHLMLITADSPVIENPPRYRLPVGQPPYVLPSLPAALSKSGLSWRNYGGYAFAFIKGLSSAADTATSAQFAVDAAAGKLPTVSWVYAPHDASEHPADPGDTDPLVGNVTHGMQWTLDQIKAVVAGGLWPKCAIFVTWDDWGGWTDHVDPPVVETWSGATDPQYRGTPFRYGSRVGCLVVSPWAKSGYVSHTLSSHVSLLKFCSAEFGLKPINMRVQTAADMTDCFDFTRSPAPAPQL